MSLTEVSSVLRRQRDLLELLVCKLEVEQLLRTAGRDRWLTLASREVAFVRAELSRSELRRAVEVDAAAAVLGLPAGIPLRELADRVPAPWDIALRAQRAALLALSDEVPARGVQPSLLAFLGQEPSVASTARGSGRPLPRRREPPE